MEQALRELKLQAERNASPQVEVKRRARLNSRDEDVTMFKMPTKVRLAQIARYARVTCCSSRVNHPSLRPRPNPTHRGAQITENPPSKEIDLLQQCEAGIEPDVIKLIEEGVNVRIEDEKGEMPLHKACRNLGSKSGKRRALHAPHEPQHAARSTPPVFRASGRPSATAAHAQSLGRSWTRRRRNRRARRSRTSTWATRTARPRS